MTNKDIALKIMIIDKEFNRIFKDDRLITLSIYNTVYNEYLKYSNLVNTDSKEGKQLLFVIGTYMKKLENRYQNCTNGFKDFLLRLQPIDLKILLDKFKIPYELDFKDMTLDGLLNNINTTIQYLTDYVSIMGDDEAELYLCMAKEKLDIYERFVTDKYRWSVDLDWSYFSTIHLHNGKSFVSEVKRILLKDFCRL